MGSEAQPEFKPSFYPWRKWGVALNVGLIVVIVFSVVVMLNYLSREYSRRFYLSSRLNHELSPLTVKFLHAMTNRVKVILYYDHNEPFYSTVVSLFTEYRRVNPRISIEAVDYLRDAGLAEKIKAQYKQLTFPTSTNLIIFESENHKPMIVDGGMLTKYTIEEVPDERDRVFRRRPVEFYGEKLFTGALLAVTSPEAPIAYYLGGHGEFDLAKDDETEGYSKFAAILKQNHVEPRRLTLEGTNGVPANCNLLIIAGPRNVLLPIELEKIDQYLSQGGRLLIMFYLRSIGVETGLEKLLAKWGVKVGHQTLKDPDKTFSGRDIIVDINSKHPLVSSLNNMQLQMIEPRSIGKFEGSSTSADGPQVDEVAFSGPHAFPRDDLLSKRAYPLIVAVEKGAIKGMITERGATRIVATGDAVFLTNRQLGVPSHVDFANSAINWLLARPQLLEAIGPRPIVEYRVIVSAKQLQKAEWVLLAGMPGTVLLLGGLVWVRRRK